MLPSPPFEEEEISDDVNWGKILNGGKKKMRKCEKREVGEKIKGKLKFKDEKNVK
jgi:hypothetical protein